MPSSRLGGKERGEQVRSVCLVRIFTEICTWAILCDVMCAVMWHDCTWRVGVFASTSPPRD